MSRALGGLGVIAMLSPVVGGLLVQWISWHAALLTTAVFGAGTLGFIALRFKESIPQRNPLATQPRRLWRNWGELLQHPTFRAYTALLCATWGGLFVMLAGSSFVFINVLGSSRVLYGVILATSSLAYIAGTLVCRRLLVRHGLPGAVKRGAVVSLAGGLSMAALSLAGVQSVWAIMLPQLLFALGHGIHQPCGQAGVVGPFPEKAGTAASLSGFAMMVTAFAIGIWLGHAPAHTVIPVTLGVGGFSIVLGIVAWTLVERHGDPHAVRAVAAAA
jgi:DHA1 family bicyclomycin/chloramphenicol resistance-like MFS transporter